MNAFKSNTVGTPKEHQSDLLAVVLSHIQSFIDQEGREPVVFDLGCGSGEISVKIAAAGARVIAIDAEDFEAEVMNRASQARIVSRLNFVQMDIRKGLAPIGKKPDIVYFNRSIESLRYNEARDVLMLLRKKNPHVAIFISSLRMDSMCSEFNLSSEDPITQA